MSASKPRFNAKNEVLQFPSIDFLFKRFLAHKNIDYISISQNNVIGHITQKNALMVRDQNQICRNNATLNFCLSLVVNRQTPLEIWSLLFS